MSKVQRYYIAAFVVIASFLALASSMRELGYSVDPREWVGQATIPETEIQKLLGKKNLPQGYLPQSEVLTRQDNEWVLQYTVDEGLEQVIQKELAKGQVKYGAFIAMDPQTNAIKAMVTHGMEENLTLRATFPAASVFKIVTAASAIEQRQLKSQSLIPVRGSYHTLYKSNLMHSGGISPASAEARATAYWKLMSLADAFGKSVNSVFGKLGIFGVGSNTLRDYSSKFYFNRALPFQMQLDESKATIPDDFFGLAESASGFTKFNTLSPLHGAWIASMIANKGRAQLPYILDQITEKNGNLIYQHKAAPELNVLSEAAAIQMQELMENTVTKGTCRGTFRDCKRHIILSQLNIGGKTGTLDGHDPEGRYDWFVGYATRGSESFAVAALCIHGELRGVKASVLARKAFEYYYKPDLAQVKPHGFSKQ